MQFFQKIFSFLPWGRKVSSRTDAKNRLKLVIAHDRAGLGPEMIEQMRQEILEVVARYVEIDPDDSDFSLANSNRETTLVANLPIRRIKTRVPEAAVSSEQETSSPVEAKGEEKTEKTVEELVKEKQDEGSEEIQDSVKTEKENQEDAEA